MLLFLWLALAHSALAQERIVSGLAKDESGNGMPGVNVLIKGTNIGTATDGNGKYQIAVNADNAVLVFSFIGYTTQEVNLGTQTALDVSMIPDTQTLNEIVVTGYAAQEKKDITGAVGVVKAKDLLAFPAANAETLLQGRVAGVTVTANGDPNGLPAVRIRGLTSFQNNTPLYIVDGVPTYNIQFLNPNDIETMNVLKDAGAASIYGSRANNGVIIVTTKKGRAGKVTVSYDGTVGVQMPGDGLESQLLNPQEMAELEWLQKSNDGLPFSSPNYGSGSTPVLPDYLVPVGAHEGDASVNPSLYNVDYAKGPIYQITRANKAGTNWWDEATDPAPVQSHNISIAGGNEGSRYMVGFNYYDQKGLFVGTGLKRYTVRANTEFKIKNVVRIGENLSAAFYDRKPLWEGVAVHTLQPIIPAYDIMGGFAGTRGSNLGNNAGIMGRLIPNEDNFSSETKIFGNVYAEVDLFKDFMFRSSFGGSLSNSYTTRFTRHYYENSENNGSNTLQENAQYENDWIWTNTITYKKKLDQHSFLVVAGMEAVKEGIGRRLQGSRIDYFTDSPDYRSLATGSAGIQNTSNYLTPSSLLSYFGRLDYNYGDKYFLSGTIRRDGSSKFTSQFGVFPSVTAAWRISQENFLQGSSVFTDLKLRVGYGSMGGQTNVRSQNQYDIYSGRPTDAYYDLGGTSSSSLPGIWQAQIGNPAGKWETKESVNVGLDASFFQGKLDVTVDWYNQTTSDLLFQLDIPSVNGSGVRPYRNVAEVENTGIDLQIINRGNITPELKYEANLTFTTVNNEVTSLAEGLTFFDVDAASTEGRIGARYIRNEVGQPISSYFGYQVQGLFQSASEVSSAPSQTGAAPGRFRFVDVNGDGQITPDDRTFLGSPLPDFTYGLNLSLIYKGFDLTVFLYGAQGFELVNYRKWSTDFPTSFQNRKSKAALYDSWTPERPNARTPIATSISNISTNQGANSYYVEDGSYLRARNVQIGFTLPTTFAKKIGMESARIYLQGVNLFTVTDYEGIDPEVGSLPTVNNNDLTVTYSDSGFGVDAGGYPTGLKQYILGVNLKF